MDEEKTFKVVLAGLYKNCDSEIRNDLISVYNISPLRVVDMTVNNNKSRSALYLVEFKKNEVSMKILREVKVIYHTVITWKPYKPK